MAGRVALEPYCAKRIVNAGISLTIYAEYYTSRNTDLVLKYFEDAVRLGRPGFLEKWHGELITPSHVSDEVLRRTATIQRSRE